MKRISVSSSGFLQGKLQVISSNSACLRNLLFIDANIRTPFPEHIRLIGALNEVRFEEKIRSDPRVANIRREETMEANVNNSTKLRGRCDIICDVPSENNTVIFELKSATSSRTLNDVIRKGKVKSDNLAQLVTYMLISKAAYGFLIYTYYKTAEGKAPEATAERAFKVTIDGGGGILIDGESSGFTVEHRMAGILAAADVLENGTIWDRPKDWDIKWKSPCTYCAFAPVCDRYDSGFIGSTVEFVNEARQLIEGIKENE